MSTRHLSRTVVMQTLFQWDFLNQQGDLWELSAINLGELAPGLVDDGFAKRLAEGLQNITWKLIKL